MNADNFYDQLNKISEQINNILMSHQMMIQNMMFHQQQMMQQQIMQQQMEEMHRMEQPEINLQTKYKINATFYYPNFGKINITVDPDVTISELLEKLRNKIGMEKYNQIKFFVINGHNIYKNDKNKLKDYFFLMGANIKIYVNY